MKRTLALILVVALTLALVACGDGGTAAVPTVAKTETQAAPATEGAAKTTAQARTEPPTAGTGTAAAQTSPQTDSPPQTTDGDPPQAGVDKDVLGHYRGIGSEMGGVKLDPTGEWVKLQGNARGIFFMLNKKYPFSWTLEGEAFTMKQDVGITYSGTLSNGKLVLDTGGMVYNFAKGDAETGAPAETDPGVGTVTDPADPADKPDTSDATKSLPAESHTFWNGDWFGYWFTEEPGGELAEHFDGRWDMCARLTLDAQGAGRMLLWDQDFSADDPLAEVEILIDLTRGDTPNGVAVTQGGRFGDRAIEAEEWVIVPGEEEYKDFIAFSGDYEDSQVSFKYFVLLRPWGQRWDDIKKEDPTALPETYDGWYLPLIEDEKPMPDAIE